MQKADVVFEILQKIADGLYIATNVIYEFVNQNVAKVVTALVIIMFFQFLFGRRRK